MSENFWPTYHIGSPTQPLHYRYEKAGLVVHEQPVPWNADAVIVEASVKLSPVLASQPGDFRLRLPDQTLLPAESLRPQDTSEYYRITFRFLPLSADASLDLLWRDRVLGSIAVPVLSREEFLAQFKLQSPTFFAQLGTDTAACQTFVANQCRALFVSGVLTSPTSLAPLSDLDLAVDFRQENATTGVRVPVRLTCTQLGGRQALVVVTPPKLSRRLSTWTARWLLGDLELASHRVRGISQRDFQRSLRVSDARFVYQADDGRVRLSREKPGRDNQERVGPCFLVCSAEAGMAGLCDLRIKAQVAGSAPPPLLEQRMLITDGLMMIAPGTLDPADLAEVQGFTLNLGDKQLALLPIVDAPRATFNGEGGFQAPPEYTWSPAAEHELQERLSRLFEQPSAN